ncbi:hypothetical protein EAY64_05560 [Aquitalea palustris]|uniref:Uncharacterized protein n=1 Tax=Aquitalea palustris TaxID=2480983 RepID=A0A454JKY6_9NEIS|nr:hypothetical protein [Aquitalea palustris]RMD00064.1 hypothetical protein EAY64_05560 [Aquitalea palustris]
MADVRALTTVHHNGKLYSIGEIFDYPDELAKQLKGVAEEGIELVNKKTTAAFKKAQQAIRDTIDAEARKLRLAYEELKAQLESDPTRADLIPQVLDAEAAAREAEQKVADFDKQSGESESDLV